MFWPCWPHWTQGEGEHANVMDFEIPNIHTLCNRLWMFKTSKLQYFDFLYNNSLIVDPGPWSLLHCSPSTLTPLLQWTPCEIGDPEIPDYFVSIQHNRKLHAELRFRNPPQKLRSVFFIFFADAWRTIMFSRTNGVLDYRTRSIGSFWEELQCQAPFRWMQSRCSVRC